ncbi:MAG: protein kinase, partial [Burkholderiales bacterium]|nr:protein kinase [Burkholderiales bacterium]
MPTTDGGENYRWGLQEFLKEARALAKFKHNHIVRVLRFLEANGTAYMVMEYEQGESLATYLS